MSSVKIDEDGLEKVDQIQPKLALKENESIIKLVSTWSVGTFTLCYNEYNLGLALKVN